MNKSITDQSTNRLTGMCDVKMKHLGNAKAFEDKQTSMKRLKYESFFLLFTLSPETLLPIVIDVSIVNHHMYSHKTFHRVQIEIEFMFEFSADCQYHHVPIFVLHG